jgi:hypothetical protein
MINSNDRARLRTSNQFSRCDLFSSLSRETSVMPKILFIGSLVDLEDE